MTPAEQNLPVICKAAVASEKLTGCPAELQAAQCILETGWLAHAPQNNCFGLKSYPGEAGRQLLTTQEWFSGDDLIQFLRSNGRTATPVEPRQVDAHGRTLYSVQDWFATFHTLGDCFAYRAKIFTQGRYAPFAQAYKENHNLEALLRGIGPIYATDPGYAEKVLALIHQGNVQEALMEARRVTA